MSRQIRSGITKEHSTVVKIAPFNPLGEHQNILLSNTVPYSPQARPQGASRLLIQCTGNNVYYRIDGLAPSANDGFVLLANLHYQEIGIGSNTKPVFIGSAVGCYLQYIWGN